MKDYNTAHANLRQILEYIRCIAYLAQLVLGINDNASDTWVIYSTRIPS